MPKHLRDCFLGIGGQSKQKISSRDEEQRLKDAPDHQALQAAVNDDGDVEGLMPEDRISSRDGYQGGGQQTDAVDGSPGVIGKPAAAVDRDQGYHAIGGKRQKTGYRADYDPAGAP